ncbi:uncharacterized protein LOC141890335 [Acropora palmata]|uniref:uncharacterized protein LOC141890335 n=1 Tax=Acropora palmata TaxID=6131 RepID=UPI003DA128F7
MQETPVVSQNTSFDAKVDVTGSEITSVGDTSFIVENGEVSILDNEDDQTSASYGDTSSDSDDPTWQVAVCFVFLFKYSYFFVALFMTIKVDVNFRTYFIIFPMLRSRFSTLADFEAILGNQRHIFF